MISIKRIKQNIITYGERYSAAVVVLILFIVFVFSEWDMLLVTGLAAFALGLLMVEQIPYRFKLALKLMIDHRVLELTNADLKRLHKNINKVKNSWSYNLARISSVAMLIAFVVAFFQGYPVTLPHIVLTLFEVAGAYIAGFYIGRTLAYGWFGIALKEEQFTLRLIPDRVDGAGGLKPIGDFYLYQAMVVAIPALFVGLWALLISLLPLYRYRYGQWREPYLGLLLLTLIFVFIALILPMWSLHKLMEYEKRKLLEEADNHNLYSKILEIDERLKVNLEDKKYDDWLHNQNLKKKLQEHCRVIERTPTWPFDVRPRIAFFLALR